MYRFYCVPISCCFGVGGGEGVVLCVWVVGLCGVGGGCVVGVGGGWRGGGWGAGAMVRGRVVGVWVGGS